jgi:hypothetical protein
MVLSFNLSMRRRAQLLPSLDNAVATSKSNHETRKFLAENEGGAEQVKSSFSSRVEFGGKEFRF